MYLKAPVLLEKLLNVALFDDCLPAALPAAQICRYLLYSEADFEVFRPAGATRCNDGGEIWRGGWDLRSPPPRVSLVRFSQNLQSLYLISGRVGC